jgi:hypothetical protein
MQAAFKISWTTYIIKSPVAPTTSERIFQQKKYLQSGIAEVILWVGGLIPRLIDITVGVVVHFPGLAPPGSAKRPSIRECP